MRTSKDKKRLYLPNEHGLFALDIPKHSLLDTAHDYSKGELLLSDFRAVLPAPDFSLQQLERLVNFSQKPDIEAPLKLCIAQKVARAIIRRVQFEPILGCWLLPLVAEYDTAGRARYPHLAIPGVTDNLSAHKLSVEYLLGDEIEKVPTRDGSKQRKLPVDHLCHRHDCCNPYHLEVVSVAENTRRGRTVRAAKQHEGNLFGDHGQGNVILPYEELKEVLGVKAVRVTRKTAQDGLFALSRGQDPHVSLGNSPTLF